MSQLLCYNRGCGQNFDPDNNTAESCRHHSGQPIFHDAYKGWSCCKKKCTDFTEFLNIKGCTVSYHNGVKPPEPEKPETVDKSLADEVIEVKPVEPLVIEQERPPFDTLMVSVKPKISQAVLDTIPSLTKNLLLDGEESKTKLITIGTECKNKSCRVAEQYENEDSLKNAISEFIDSKDQNFFKTGIYALKSHWENCIETYEGEESNDDMCVYHPGYPVFHEGLKFWSCCTKRTTDFDTFLSQVGCQTGKHTWVVAKRGEEVKCRVDWHQTASFVYVSVFAKRYHPHASVIELSPVRLKLTIFFPEQEGFFIKDIELSKMVDVKTSAASMNATKIEIKLQKLHSSTWSHLEMPKTEVEKSNKEESSDNDDALPDEVLENMVDSVDLNFI